MARIVRGQVLSLREKEFVEAARSLGASDPRIIFREILPNLVAPIIVYATILIPQNILFEAALSFLGVGVEPCTPSWGAMISDAIGVFDIAWWFMTFPGLALLLTVLAFNLVGDGLQDALNPRTQVVNRKNQHARSMGTHQERTPHDQDLRFDSLAALALVALAVFVVACGSDDELAATRPARQQRCPHRGQEGRQARAARRLRRRLPRPGQTYYTGGFQVIYATQTPLYSFKPDERRSRARTSPTASRRSPTTRRPSRSRSRRASSSPAGQPRGPGQGRQVRLRALLLAERRRPVPDVLQLHRGRAEEADAGVKHDLRHHDARRPVHDRVQARPRPPAPGFAAFLVMPITAPVPRGVRGEVRREEPVDVQQATSSRPARTWSRTTPQGKLVGYKAGKWIDLVRNPNWDPKQRLPAGVPGRDPAATNATDANVAGRQVLAGPEPGPRHQPAGEGPEAGRPAPEGPVQSRSRAAASAASR